MGARSVAVLLIEIVIAVGICGVGVELETHVGPVVIRGAREGRGQVLGALVGVFGIEIRIPLEAIEIFTDF